MTWSVGQELPSIEKLITLERIARYAHASGDANPIHLDPAFAAQSAFGRIVAHGMLGLAFVSDMLTQAFGEDWLASGRLRVRFRSPAYPGDQVVTYGQVTKSVSEGRGRVLHCTVGLRRSDGQEIITGDATVVIAGG